jgi:hypothetical protein
MLAGDVPSTSSGSSEAASFSGVCPPSDTTTPTSSPERASASSTAPTSSGVSGSKYSRSEVS